MGKSIQGAYLGDMSEQLLWEQKAYKEIWHFTRDVKKIVSIDHDVIIGSAAEDVENELLSRNPAPDYCTHVVPGERQYNHEIQGHEISSLFVSRAPVFTGGAGSYELDFQALLQTVRKHGQVLVTSHTINQICRKGIQHIRDSKEGSDFSSGHASVLAHDVVYRPPATANDYGRVVRDVKLAKALSTRKDNKARAEKLEQERQERRAKERSAKQRDAQRLSRMTTERSQHLEHLIHFLQKAYQKAVPSAGGVIKFEWLPHNPRNSEQDKIMILVKMFPFLEATVGKTCWRRYYGSRSKVFGGSPGKVKRAVRLLFKQVRIYRRPWAHLKAFTLSWNGAPNEEPLPSDIQESMRKFAKWLGREHGYLTKKKNKQGAHPRDARRHGAVRIRAA